jgi:hypothetical protein
MALIQTINWKPAKRIIICSEHTQRSRSAKIPDQNERNPEE